MISNPGWDRQTVPSKETPHGWIQWKGTNVCMDIKCVCGKLSHVDSEFAYYIKCVECNRVFMVNGHVELVELNPDEIQQVEDVIESS